MKVWLNTRIVRGCRGNTLLCCKFFIYCRPVNQKSTIWQRYGIYTSHKIVYTYVIKCYEIILMLGKMFFQKHQLKDLVIRFFFLIWNSRSGLFFVKSKNCWSVQCNTVYQIFSAAWNFCGKNPIRNLLTLSSVFSISAVKKWWKKKDCNFFSFGVLLYEIFHRLSFCLFFIGPNYSVHQEHR